MMPSHVDAPQSGLRSRKQQKRPKSNAWVLRAERKWIWRLQAVSHATMNVWIRLAVCAAPAVLAGTVVVAQMAQPETAPGASQAQGPFELVDPKVLRVCADPHNLPYSDTNGAGFENRIAELFAKELGKGISFTWFPNAPGFVSRTLALYKCDIIMGVRSEEHTSELQSLRHLVCR